jgi:hypothetical protein
MFQRIYYRVVLRFIPTEALPLELAAAIRMRMRWCEERVLEEMGRRGTFEVRA